MYGKAKVSKPDWYMMGICIVFALTFSLRSVPLVPKHPDGTVRADSADVRGLR